MALFHVDLGVRAKQTTITQAHINKTQSLAVPRVVEREDTDHRRQKNHAGT